MGAMISDQMYNVRFRWLNGRLTIFVLEDIEQGTELSLWYGLCYWDLITGLGRVDQVRQRARDTKGDPSAKLFIDYGDEYWDPDTSVRVAEYIVGVNEE